MNRKNFLIFLFISLLLWNFYNPNAAKQDSPKIKPAIFQHVNKLIINPNDNSTYNIPINPPEELDFLSKDAVFNIRKKYAAMTPEIIPANYEPSDAVFGQITSGKPWWGIGGELYKGSGEHSIDGLSEETRFINNPLLFIWVDCWWEMMNHDSQGPEIYSKPISITFQPRAKTITIYYDMSDFEKNFKALHQTYDPNYTMNYETNFVLRGDNARDFGYNYAYAYSNDNVIFEHSDNLTTGVQQLKNYLHTGGSCGYSGGCNNGSPDQPYMDMHINSFPAKLCIRLWKKMPTSKDAQADLYVIMVFQ